MLNKTVIVICGTIIGLALLATYVVLKSNHIDANDFLPFLIGVSALIPSTAAWNNSREIKKQTNGPLSQTHETVSNIEERLVTLESSVQDLSTALSKDTR